MSKRYELFFVLLSLIILLLLFLFPVLGIIKVIIIVVLSVTGIIIWIRMIISPDSYNYAKKLIEIKVPRTAKLVEEIEEHGGFSGDGKSYLVFNLNEKEASQVKTQIFKNKNWVKLPLQGIALEKSKIFIKEGYFGSNRMRDMPINGTNGAYYFNGSEEINYCDFTFSFLDYQNKILYILRVDA
ncbi:hypothetical protein [Clostridium sp.]|uniref:hypothetical protein n=1 Tax=Clostridium sp. TaxID=1506 RepID=UPI003D6C8EB2